MKYKKDYYQILGIETNATPEEIKLAYRRLAMLNHPDKNPALQGAIKMQEINEAYSILGNEHKRVNYDFERGNSFTSSQASSSNANAAKKAENLEQFFSEKTDVESTVIFVFMILSLPFTAVILFFFDFRITLASISLLSFLPVTLGILFWRSFKSKEKEKQCPKCGEPRSAEFLEKTSMGIFKKWVHYQDNSGRSFTYRKYKIHYRCKYCSYEWLCIKTEKLDYYI